ncbi:MAG TPA: hypothetical protein GX505_13455 [Clostridiales bacterium]|nr:hypothetical protein [Clostridiales bacterium]
MLRKVLAVLLTITLILSLAAGCSKPVDEKPGGDKQESTPKPTQGSSEGGDPVQKERVPITITLPSVPSGTQPDSYIEKLVEDKFNIDLNVIPLPSNSDDRKTQINLMMTDEKLRPDIIYFGSSSAKEYEEWKANGLLVDLYPLLAKHGSNIVSYYKKVDNDASALFSTWENGKMYRLITDVSEPGSTTTVVRKDWLDKFGMEIETLEDYMEYLRKCVYEDPDGNGQNDTVGLTGGKEDMMALYPFYSAYGVYPEEWIIQEDGSIKYGAVLPETKEALRVISEAYKEGLIDPNLISGAKSFTDELFVEGKAASFHTWAFFLTPSFAPLHDFQVKNPGAEYIRQRPVKGPDGFASDRPSDPFGSGYVAITSKCKDPEVAMQLLDGLMEPEFSILIKNGEEGIDYVMENGEIKLLTSKEERDAKGIRMFALLLERKDEYNIEIGEKGNANFADQQQHALPLRAKFAFLRDKVRPKNNEYQANLNTLYKTTFWSIIAGELPIDAFDQFVEEWYAQGGAEVEQEANEYWAKQKIEMDEFKAAFDRDLAKLLK